MHDTYLTYSEYQAYGGSLPEPEFKALEFKCRKRVDWYTDMRVQDMAAVPEEVKRCIYEIIPVMEKFDIAAQVENPLVSSFNTDGYSESYGGIYTNAGANKAEDAYAAVDALIKQLLYGVKDDKGVMLLYRGVRG